MRKYFSDEAWAQFGDYWSYWPPPKWLDFYLDVESALDEDPASERAEALVARFYVLWHEDTGNDPALKSAIRQGCATAWADRDNWPPPLRDAWSSFDWDAIGRFIGAASLAALERRGPQFFAPR